MSDITLEPNIQAEMTDIAESYGFTNVLFDTEHPHEGFRCNLASSETPIDITYRHLFLEPAIQFHSIDQTLFEKSTKILTLFMKTYHESFDSNPDVDDYLVQKQASEEYGDLVEMMFLDILTIQFSRIPYLDDNEIKDEVFGHAEKYDWIESTERNAVYEELSKKENYEPKNLRKILIDRGIIPAIQNLS